MKITALVENNSHTQLKPKHGLSLYIETPKHKILFDLGPDNTLFDNAKLKGIDLSEVDVVVISHGHLDHGGALGKFFEINDTATVYIQKRAFEPHFTKFLGLKFPCGIDKAYADHPRVKLLEGNYDIDDELSLFTVKDISKCYSFVNDKLYEGKQQDRFEHEQDLIIKGDKNVLIMGCGHAGIVNILNEAKSYNPALCIGGYHLMDPNSKKVVSNDILDEIANEMNKYKDTKFYTCHCTGEVAYKYLANKVPNLSYLSCGESVEL